MFTIFWKKKTDSNENTEKTKVTLSGNQDLQEKKENSLQYQKDTRCTDTLDTVQKNDSVQENVVETKETENKIDNVKNEVVKKVESVLYENDLDKLKYFFRRFFEENIGKQPNISIIEEYNIGEILNLQVEDIKFKKEVPTLVLELLAQEWFEIEKMQYSIHIKNKMFLLIMSSYYWSSFNFKIKPLVKVDDDFLKYVKWIFEQYFIPYLENFNEYKLTINDVAWLLHLSPDDKILLDEDKLTILISWKNIYPLDEKNFVILANYLANQLGFFIQVENYFGKLRLKVVDQKDYFTYHITLSFKNNMIEYFVEPYYRSKLTRNFLQNFMQVLIKLVNDVVFSSNENLVEKLEELGVKVQISDGVETIEQLFEEKWFAWYEDLKENILTHIVEPWKNKEKYTEYVNKKLPALKNIVPNAVLFYGVPWTGKTTMASILGEYLWYPFVYIPINSIMSKWFWESENKLNKILEACWLLAKEKWWVVIMIDEIDEIWKNREKTSSDASNRILWVLLKKLDWLEKLDNILLIGSTNLSNSLDPALLSRFSQQIEFRLPDEKEIISILKYYLPILEDNGIDQIARMLKWKSWRDLKKNAEDFARFIIKNEINSNYNQEFKKFISNGRISRW